MAKRYCPKCGAKLNGRFCTKCGYDSGAGDWYAGGAYDDTRTMQSGSGQYDPTYDPLYDPNNEDPGAPRKKKKKSKAPLIAVIVAVAAAAAVCAFMFLRPKSYTVTFDPGDGQLVSGLLEQTVKEGEKAETPEVEREGYVLSGWSPEVSAVEGDTTYTAVWDKQQYNAEELYQIAENSVVEIHIYLKDGTAYSLGSGFFTDTDGTIVTNFHVIENAYKIEAELHDGRSVDVDTVVGWDKNIDLAVLKCDTKSEPLKMSDEDVRTGEEVYAIGSPLGQTSTMSEGIVSQSSRVSDGVDYIQFTAPISHGNSGGPLLNPSAEVIGITTGAYEDGQNLNMAINAKMLDDIDTSHPMTVEEYTQQEDRSDPGEAWISGAANSEEEDNNKASTANLLYQDETTGGYVDADDHDYYEIDLKNSASVAIIVQNCYDVDNEYMRAVLLDGNMRGGYDLEDGETDDGIAYKYFAGDLDAGTYYVYIELGESDKEYPYSTGAYYAVWYYFMDDSDTDAEPETPDTITVIHNIQAPASDFLFANSSTELLTQDDLDSMLSSDQDTMRSKSQMAINEIYARYGWTFATSENPSSTALEAKEKFEALDWYKEAQQYCPTTDSDVLYKKYLNSVERQNIMLIRDWQNQHVTSS